MNEEWLHKVRRRMADYETDAPEHLWTAIEERQRELSEARRKTRRPAMLTWVQRGIAAAALLAIVASVFLYSPEEHGDTRRLPPPSAVAERPATVSQEGKLLLAENAALAAAGKEDAAGIALRTETSHHAMDSGQPQQEASAAEGDGDAHRRKSPASSCEKAGRRLPGSPDPKTIRYRHSRTATDNGHKASLRAVKPDAGNLSVAAFMSGGAGAMLSRRSPASIPASSIGHENTYWKDAPMLGVLLFNQGAEIETDIRHRHPVRAGISLTYRIGSRLGIESGISYTNLTSDIREGSERHYLAARQRLHYIGIPLNVKYRLLSWKRLSLYASAGVLAEKCVSASLDREVVLDRQATASETEKLHEKPMQWSANASLGLQCDIIKPVGLFVEPGMSYYFKDGTTLQTIYKDKPLNVNLNLGIRLTFGE